MVEWLKDWWQEIIMMVLVLTVFSYILYEALKYTNHGAKMNEKHFMRDCTQFGLTEGDCKFLRNFPK